MFAFSQIISSGQKVSTVTQELEKDDTIHQNQLDENEAILAFSNQMPGNEDEPKFIEVDERQKIKENTAQKELDELNSNDATSAFSVLAQAEEIEKKVELTADENDS